MNLSITARFLATAALAAASVAQARTDFYLSIGLPGLPVYVEAAPVRVRPEPVYAQPRPVYVQPPANVFERPRQPAYASEFERERAWRHAQWQRREWQRRHHEWDRFRPYGRDRD